MSECVLIDLDIDVRREEMHNNNNNNIDQVWGVVCSVHRDAEYSCAQHSIGEAFSRYSMSNVITSTSIPLSFASRIVLK